MTETAGEYRDESFRILMEDEKYPVAGYRPRDIRDKILSLLEKAEKLKKG